MRRENYYLVSDYAFAPTIMCTMSVMMMKTVRYWRMVIIEAFTQAWGKTEMRAAIVILLIAVVGASILVTLQSNALLPQELLDFVNDVVEDARVQTFYWALTALLTFILFLFFLLYIPAQIHDEQRKKIEGNPPERLKLTVGPSPMGGIINSEGKHTPMARLVVISHENKKIVEFHAERIELLQRTADMPEDVRGKQFRVGWKTSRFAWENGEIFNELIPGATDEIILAELNPDTGRPLFGNEKFQTDAFDQTAIYELNIQLKGKLEGETSFSYYNYLDELYCSPENLILEFAEMSIDIPRELMGKVLFARKEPKRPK